MSEEDVNISGYQQTLESGAKVFIGTSTADDRSVYIKFTNPEGMETRLFLSIEAMNAVFEIWSKIALLKPSVYTWKVELKEDDGALICKTEDPA